MWLVAPEWITQEPREGDWETSKWITSGLVCCTPFNKFFKFCQECSSNIWLNSGSGIFGPVHLLNTNNIVRKDGIICFEGWCGVGWHFLLKVRRKKKTRERCQNSESEFGRKIHRKKKSFKNSGSTRLTRLR